MTDKESNSDSQVPALPLGAASPSPSVPLLYSLLGLNPKVTGTEIKDSVKNE